MSSGPIIGVESLDMGGHRRQNSRSLQYAAPMSVFLLSCMHSARERTGIRSRSRASLAFVPGLRFFPG